MKKLEIVNIENYNYELKDEYNNSYNLILEFYDLKEPPRIGEYIYMSDKLLMEKMLAFGPLGSKYGKAIKDENDDDIVVLTNNNEKIYLQRYYG